VVDIDFKKSYNSGMKKYSRVIKDGIQEVKQALLSREQWFYMANQDIKLRYRRSIIGPWWVTISTGLMILILGFLWSHIFNQTINNYLPYFAIGFVVWNWMSAQVLDSAAGFREFQGVIKQIKLPFAIFILRLNMRQGLILLHNSLIIILILSLMGKQFHWINLMAIPQLFLIQCNLTFLSIIITIFCTRYQDMTQVINVATQIIFFFTPILWQIETLKNRVFLAEWNPIYHWIELIRAPLLGNIPTISNYIWSSLSLIILFLLAIYYLGRYRSRIALWL
jgi:lipopolysaccharide transport system permease protein